MEERVCTVCGKKVSTCRATLDFYPRERKFLFSRGLAVTAAYKKGRVIVTP